MTKQYFLLNKEENRVYEKSQATPCFSGNLNNISVFKYNPYEKTLRNIFKYWKFKVVWCSVVTQKHFDTNYNANTYKWLMLDGSDKVYKVWGKGDYTLPEHRVLEEGIIHIKGIGALSKESFVEVIF